jgi:hypothetical protein
MSGAGPHVVVPIKKDLIRNVDLQVKENKAIKDMVTETFPALQEMSAVNAPELQFLMDSDKPPKMPELTPLLPGDSLPPSAFFLPGFFKPECRL